MVQSNIVPDGFKTKANSLKTTAGNQSKSEVASTQDTDLDTGNKPETGLKDKANLLAQKAEALSEASGLLESAATTDTALKPLKDTAGALKNAAGTSGGTSGLFKAAEELAKQAGSPAEDQANQVINAFEEVEKHYLALMEVAGDNKLTSHDEVTSVIKAYHAVKNTYYQMLIVFRIQKKAEAFHTAAETLKSDAAQAAKDGTNQKLKALHTSASLQIQQLVGAA